MEIDAENVNYLISRCARLEKWNGRLEKRIEGANEAIGVHRKDIVELEHQLKHKDEYISRLKSDPDLIVEYEDKIAELNKELEITEKARVKWKERCEKKEHLLNIELAHSKTNSRRIEELQDSLTSHQQRINELVDGNKCNKEELNMRIKELEAHEIKPWSNDKRILENLQENLQQKERIKELEEQLKREIYFNKALEPDKEE